MPCWLGWIVSMSAPKTRYSRGSRSVTMSRTAAVATALFRIKAGRTGNKPGALHWCRVEEGKKIMKRLAFVALGIVIGFAAAAGLSVVGARRQQRRRLSRAQSVQRGIRARSRQLCAPGGRQRIDQRRDRRDGVQPRSPFQLYGPQSLFATFKYRSKANSAVSASK